MTIKSVLDQLQQQGVFTRWAYCEQPEAQTFAYYKDWLDRHYNGPLEYLKGERATLRQSLKSFFSEFQSSFVFTFSYAHVAHFLQQFYLSKKSNKLKIASYAYAFSGEDYHHYIRRELDKIAERLNELDPDLEYKLSLDIHPVLERDLAVRSGLGWFGKNSMFISQEDGSFLMIGAILLSKKFNIEAKEIVPDHCGTCQRCIDSCPTDAILDSRMIDAGKCISTFTIEQFKMSAVPPQGMESAAGEIFGCDICQNICPWNIKLFKHLPKDINYPKSPVDDFLIKEGIDLIETLQGMSNREYRRLFRGTALERTGRVGMLKNLYFWQKVGLL